MLKTFSMQMDLEMAKRIRDPKDPAFAGRLSRIEEGRLQFSAFGNSFFWQGSAGDFKVGDFLYFDGAKLHLLASPEVGAWQDRESDHLRQQEWSQFLAKVRETFHKQGLQEVTTTSLVVCPGVETYIDPIATSGKNQEVKYLPTSPEIQHKKLLAQDYGDIYEIKECFRQEIEGALHKQNFLMLEWYRSYANLDLILEDVEALVCAVFSKEARIKKKSVAAVFLEVYNFRLQPDTGKEELIALCEAQNIPYDDGDSWNDIFHRLFLEKIEPQLKQEDYLVLYHYPPQLAALATIHSDAWADRFELFIKGVEVANAYNELLSREAYEARFRQINQERQALGKEVIPLDDEFLNYMETGMPPSAGIALGLERLFMLAHDYKSI